MRMIALILLPMLSPARALTCSTANDCHSAASCAGLAPGQSCEPNRVCVVVEVEHALLWGDDDICCGCNYSSVGLSSSEGPPIPDTVVADLLDQHIPANNAHSTLAVFTQCFGGGLLDDLADRPNTAAMSASLYDQAARYTGYDDDAAAALYPESGRSSDAVHAAGVAGKSALEDPLSQGDSVSLAPVGEDGLGSRHVLVYAGAPEALDDQIRDQIVQNFAGQPDTTVTTVGGAGAADGWDYPGTFEGFRDALIEISALMDADEQFILFVTDHGGQISPPGVVNFVEVDGELQGDLAVGIPEPVFEAMMLEPNNVPAICAVGPYWIFPVSLEWDGGTATLTAGDLTDFNLPYDANPRDDYADQAGCFALDELSLNPDGTAFRLTAPTWAESDPPQIFFTTGNLPKLEAEPEDTGEPGDTDVPESRADESGPPDDTGAPGPGGERCSEGCGGGSKSLLVVLLPWLRRRRAARSGQARRQQRDPPDGCLVSKIKVIRPQINVTQR